MDKSNIFVSLYYSTEKSFKVVENVSLSGGQVIVVVFIFLISMCCICLILILLKVLIAKFGIHYRKRLLRKRCGIMRHIHFIFYNCRKTCQEAILFNKRHTIKLP